MQYDKNIQEPDSLRNAIRKQWVISDVDFTALMKLAGRVV